MTQVRLLVVVGDEPLGICSQCRQRQSTLGRMRQETVERLREALEDVMKTANDPDDQTAEKAEPNASFNMGDINGSMVIARSITIHQTFNFNGDAAVEAAVTPREKR
jgi:hypothetical protein